MLAMNWVAAAGSFLVRMLGVNSQEGDVQGRLVGALLLLFVIYLVWFFLRALPPQGKPEGNGYKLGHRVVLVANIMAGLLLVFHFFLPGIEDHNTHLVLENLATALGYLAMGCFAVGFSFIYQSSLPQEKKS
jgi:hypothetical protein